MRTRSGSSIEQEAREAGIGRGTILQPARRDPKKLPLDAFEGFVLSQVDGRLTLGEVAEIAGLELGIAVRVARRLLDLGAVTSADAELPPRSAGTLFGASPISRTERVVVPRTDPDEAPQEQATSGVHERRKVERAVQQLQQQQQQPQREPRRRRSTRGSLRAVSPDGATLASAQKRDDETCDLDEAVYGKIVALDATLGTLDHYAMLEIERGTEEKAIKRAYFGLAAKFHPDRFFGKKLGPARSPLVRIFARLTEAHDVLTHRARRAEYDATLPPAPPAAPPPANRPSRSMRKPSKAAMKAVSTPAPAPVSEPKLPPATRLVIHGPPASAARIPVHSPPPSVRDVVRVPVPPPMSVPAPPITRKSRRMNAVSKDSARGHLDVFLQAGDEAMRADDPIGAANNYRLALQIVEDAAVRQKLEAADALAKTRRHERSMNRARAAEKDQRWPDAATHFALAHELYPDAKIADRAAYAMRLSEGGDLHRAAALAEYAVSQDPNNATYRVTLGEIYFAAKVTKRAMVESAKALELAPEDPRAGILAAALGKKK